MFAGWTLVAAAAVGSGPYAYSQGYPAQGTMMPSGYPSASFEEVTSSGVSSGYGDQLYPYESQDPWLHGYFQEIPAYGGYHSFKPYNYKHVLSQSQTAAGFGMSPVMPYSQQFWHRYENRANFSPYANEPGAMPPVPVGPMGMGMPQSFPGVGMAPSSAFPALGMTAPAASQAAAPAQPAPAPNVQPAEWNAGPAIVPAKAEDPAQGKGRWGRWAQPGER